MQAKMLRLARLKRVLKRIDEQVRSNNQPQVLHAPTAKLTDKTCLTGTPQFPGIWTVSKLSGLMMIILYISHIFACLWYVVGTMSEQVTDNGNGECLWLISASVESLASRGGECTIPGWVENRHGVWGMHETTPGGEASRRREFCHSAAPPLSL